VFLSPRLCGGRDALGSVAGTGVEHIGDALPLTRFTASVMEGDIYLHGFVEREMS
jgi:hypothetical protein